MLNTIQKNHILEDIAKLERDISQLEALLNGSPIRVVRIADASITNAKIVSLGVDKLTTGQLSVSTDINIGDPASGDYIRESGGDLNIILFVDGVEQLVIGDDGS